MSYRQLQERAYQLDARTLAGMPSWLAFDEKRMLLVMEAPECGEACCAPPFGTSSIQGGVTYGSWPYARVRKPGDRLERPELGELGYWQHNDSWYYVHGPEGSLAPLGATRDLWTARSLADYLNGDWQPAEHPSHVELPAKFEVCGLCGGRGSHVNPAIDAHGLTWEDFADDPDFAENYFDGVYDQDCNECGGRRVVPVPDPDRCDPALLKVYIDGLQDDYDYRRLCAQERAMGC